VSESLIEAKLRECDEQMTQLRDADDRCREFQRGHVYHMLAGMRALERVKSERGGAFSVADFRAKR
jgi:hypothetical protein